MIKKTRILTLSISIIYLWFGLLKFFPQLSPAEELAKETISLLTLGLIPGDIAIILLAILELAIGLFFLFNKQLKKTVIVAIGHLIFTFVPLLFLPHTSFNESPFALTLVGQYIIKNIVIISALLIIYPIKIDKQLENN